MKAALFALGVMAAPLQAQLYADVSTTMGDFTLELFYEDSPMTVANFVSLAEGSRKWIDPATGIVQENKPYFDGIIFHRVIDGFMNQVGSPQGTGSDGPGYNFPDEVDNGLQHDVPYLLSSANSGPHTNGSQMFITVAETDWLDRIHTVFGKVTAGTDVIDAINTVPVGKIFNGRFDSTRPVDDVSITSVSIRREGAEAQAFDVTAQGLPEVSQVETGIERSEGGVNLMLDQAAGTTLNVFRSLNLENWRAQSRHLDPSQSALMAFEVTDGPGREFYRSALLTWPTEATFPSDLDGWSITINDPGNAFNFVIEFSDEPTLTFQGGNVYPVDMERTTVDTDGYGANLLIHTLPIGEVGNLVPLRFRLGSDLPINVSNPSGRMTGTAFTSSPFAMSGTFSMSQLP